MSVSLRSWCSTIAVILTLALLMGGAATAQAKCEADRFVQSVGEAYDRAASTGSASAFASAAARYSDLRALSLFALGRYRKELPKAREAEFLKLTRDFIGETLKTHGSGFAGTSLKIIECKEAGGNLVVTARTSGGARVIFRLARAGGGFTVRDVNMKGVWLVQQMRSTFVGTINRTGSIDGLFKYLKS
jgi:phospholipid transport system substrate-binding protein